MRWAKVATGIVFASLILAEAAVAQTPTPEEKAALWQYREALPTAGGPVIGGQGEGTAAPLPSGVERLLRTRAGSDGGVLERIATDPELGAPSVSPRRPIGVAEADESAVSAAFDALGTRDAHVRGLLLFLGLATGWAAASSLSGRRLRRAEQRS